MPLHSTPTRNAVRIISGQWKRSVITFADSEGLRPTPDRVRETVFNWLGQDLTGLSVLDAFTGTGVMALEAASRGAGRVVAMDTEAKVVQTVRAHAKRLGAQAGAPDFEVLRGEALSYLNKCNATFDVVFFDPPFHAQLYDALEESAARILSDVGRLYVEAPREFMAFGDLKRVKYLRAGAVHAHLFSR